MSRVNRTANRVVLLLCGALLLSGAALVLVREAQPAWFAAVFQDAAHRVAAADADVSGRLGVQRGILPTVVAGTVLAVLAVLLIVFLLTRRSGRTRTVIAREERSGDTYVERGVVEDLVVAPLSERPDVLSAGVRVYERNRARMLHITVRPRAGASLARILGAAQDAVADWDDVAGAHIPAVLHLADRSWTDGFRSAVRVR